ncbi:MAG: asparagine synthase-related protein [Thiobacillus sp.]|nr:asparagine synthase-related protein [Thiobacillus sp.]
MTLLAGIVDPDAAHARQFMAGTHRLAPTLPWLTHTDTRLGRLSLSLDSAPQSPYSTCQSTTGRAVFILGDILGQPGTDSATWLEAQSLDLGPEALGRQNGYYVAGMVDEQGAVYLAADQLGLMPLYYWTENDRFCFSSSPNAFLSHPRFSPKPDLMGIAGTLLTMSATGNRTTWQDVRRLPPGHLLRWRAQEGVRITDVNSLKVHDRYFGWPLDRCQNLIQNTFNESVNRLAKLGDTSLLLSGGLDSRLVAGCLRWHLHYKAPIVTLGESADYEMQCARRVAKSLGWPLYPVAVDQDAYRDWAPVQARLEGMQTSFVEFMWWQALEKTHALKPRIMTGLLGDAIMGATQITFGLDENTQEYAFDSYFARANRYGFTAADTSRLLKAPGLGEAVVEELRADWNAYEGLPFQKCWQFDLQHRQRLHVGPAAWRLSFGAWPTLPFTDCKFVEVMAGMAVPVMGGRRAQYGMLKLKFPKLAVLPLDRSGSDTTPVVPSLSWALKRQLSRPFEAFLQSKHIERRQYVRHFNVNGTGWQAVRKLSENSRPAVRNLFDHAMLKATLPPEGPLATSDPIIDGARYKTLMGLMLQFGATIAGENT